ncbi:flagellar assembly protein T N-terminal domain-containing protein [Reinekea sp. G2M2-21]|uniref:flagellar assembly protein T N-terminal domain-containing protein n=1 Tax=Reinekea sp. G2M2-21 TaxID=2788942 RepID=UPI0018A8DAEA|nr:flagellar assembly protein T N-terminal domain-containing protein [Reinekea sp. G2M2-21]
MIRFIRFTVCAWLLFCVSYAPFGFAADMNLVQVDAEGISPIEYNDENSARLRAMRNAIENASMQVSANVQSTQVIENGNLTVDYLRINSAAKVTDIRIISEGRDGDLYRVRIMAKVSPDQICANVMANHYRKSVAITGFSMEHPEHATLGHLGAVDRSLAALLVNDLNGRQGIRALSANYMTLYPNTPNAPTQISPRMTLTRAVSAAKDLGVQFVVSGVIRDMAMENPEAPRASNWDKWLKRVGVTKAKRTRHFVFDVFVHDGYSGALVFQSRYRTYGLWNERNNTEVGFGTAKYFSTDYGQQVRVLLNQAVADIQTTVQCQPFMATIAQVDGNRIFVSSGAESGLRPGDFLSVYRTSQKFDRQGDSFWQIIDTRLAAEVKQVQPYYAVAEMAIGVERLNLQVDDLVMAW